MFPASHIVGQVSLDFIAEGKLEVVAVVPKLFRIVSFDRSFLVTFHVDHTVVDIDGNGFELARSEEFSEDLEVGISQHLGCFVTEVPQKARYRFGFFDRNGKFIDQGIALQQFQPFQFINPNKVTMFRRDLQHHAFFKTGLEDFGSFFHASTSRGAGSNCGRSYNYRGPLPYSFSKFDGNFGVKFLINGQIRFF